MRKRIISYSIASIFLISAAIPMATEACCVAADSASWRSDTLATSLSELEVVATSQGEQNRSASPLFILNHDRIAKGGVTDISDALLRLPGINLRDYGGCGGMKTVSVRGLGATHTGVVYDGIALPENQGGEIDLSRFSLSNMNSISLHIGDNDEIFSPARAQALSTTLSITTLNIPRNFIKHIEGSFKLRGGSFGTINPAIHLAASDKQKVSFSLNAEYLHSRNNYPFTLRNGVTTTRERRQHAAMNSYQAEMSGIYTPDSINTIDIKAYLYNSGRQLPGPVIYYASPSNEYLKDKNYFGAIGYQADINAKWKFKSKLRFSHTQTHYTDHNLIYTNGILDKNYRQNEQYITLLTQYTPLEVLALSYSTDFWHNDLSANQGLAGTPQRYSWLQCLAAQTSIARFRITGKLLYSYHYDKEPESSENSRHTNLLPSLSCSFRVADQLPLYIRGSYKRSMRMPTFNELYYDHYGTVNLRPELTDQLNIGCTWGGYIASWLPRLDMTIDGYYNRVSNKIVAIPYNLFIWTMTNLGKVRGLGADITLSAAIRLAHNHSLQLTGNYSYQRIAPRTSRLNADWMKQVAYTPLNSGAWSLCWQNPWVNLVAHGTGAGPRFTTNANLPTSKIPGYMLTGFAIYRQFRLHKVSLEARIDLINAFDKQYSIVSRYPMPGRSLNATIEINI